MQRIVKDSMKAKASFAKIYLYFMHQIYVLVQKHMESKLKKNGLLSFSQYWVLVCFIDCKDETKQTASEVAKKMYITEATLSGHIERMLRQKLIIKKLDAKNRRQSIIHLTDKGKKSFMETRKVIDHELEKIFNVVRVGDRKNVLNAFDKVLTNLINNK